jgi:putative membrane protein
VIAERDPRVYFAAERTLLAWIRTGLAMMGFGFVVARFGLFLRELAVVSDPASTRGSASLAAGTTLVFLGVIVNVYAAIAHARFTKRFRAGDSDPRPSHFGVVLASVLAAAGFAMAIYLIARG